MTEITLKGDRKDIQDLYDKYVAKNGLPLHFKCGWNYADLPITNLFPEKVNHLFFLSTDIPVTIKLYYE